MITVNALSYRYPKASKLALNDVNLKIEGHSIFGLLGPNGAGKTTLISLLTGLLTSKDGSIQVMGRAFPADSRKIKTRYSYVPQDYAFYPNLTAYENLQFFAGVQGITGKKRQQRIHYCLEFCQLNDVAKQFASHFSGGLKRRLNLAIGLLTDPAILYLDEPTVGIDPQSRAFILTQIKALREQGKAIIYTSHYMEEIEQICDQLAIIDDGKVLFSGSLNTLQEQQKAWCCIGIKQPLSIQLINKIKQNYSMEIKENSLFFDGINHHHDCSTLTQTLSQNGVHITSIEFGSASLENIFLNLTQRNLRD